MTATRNILAFDLGAESGRAMLAGFDGQKLTLREVHRFPNVPALTLDRLHWDVLFLFNQIVEGLRHAAGQADLSSVGIDTWGVDFGLLGSDGGLLGNPRHYRDPHTEGIMEDAFAVVPRGELFRRTGIQFMRFNSLFQLLAMRRDRSPILEVARHFLMIPDLLNYWLTGIKVNEFTNATTSQMVNPFTRRWDEELIRQFGLPDRILGTIVEPGTVLGPLRQRVASDSGLSPIPVIAPATHDTGSAVAAVPARGDDWAFISSGTWSLMGAELSQPIVNEDVQAANFTNEGGVGQTVRFLKNISGLWLVQECKRAWEKSGRSFRYDELVQLAGQSEPFVSLIDPDDPGFMLPPDMPRAIAEFCRRTGQPAPIEPGAVIRCALESLALRYRWVLEKLEQLLGRRLSVIHVVGGGSQNELLCQLTADACNRPVLAGPVEATAIGNVLVQAIGLKLVTSLAEAREVVRRSWQLRTYEPRRPDAWGEPYARFLEFSKR
ncbi:MAG: rhamnulokinase [Gemmataceae bacterium]|nr:rhamnulokinase [Gemmataceae bacterium]